jgi:hypothetical protein
MPSKLSGGLKAANLIAAPDPNGRPCGMFPSERLNCRMAKRTLRSRESEGVTNWYCNSCAWSVTVFDGRSELIIQQVRSDFETHVCSEKYSE